MLKRADFIRYLTIVLQSSFEMNKTFKIWLLLTAYLCRFELDDLKFCGIRMYIINYSYK